MKKLFAILFFVFSFLLLAPAAFAEQINSFDSTITAHKDGTMNVVEKINYDFEYGSRHGIFRYIPLYSKVGDLYRVIKIKDVHVSRDGRKEQFSTTTSKEQVYFKIGNPDKTITGAHLYEISYLVENGIGSNFSDHDEIYWNVTGNGWDVQIATASATFNTDFGLNPTQLLCFTGVEGSKESQCEASGNAITTSSILYSSYGISGVAVYPVGTFPKSTLYKELPKTSGEKLGLFILKALPYIYLFLNVFLPIYLYFWYQKRKNKKRFGPPAVNFEIPKDGKERIAPAAAGTIDASRLDKDDVTATIFDLAIRKYMRLDGSREVKKLAPDVDNLKIVRLKDSEGLNEYEKSLYDRLFESGESVDVKDLAVDFYQTYQDMERLVFSELVSKGYYTKNPKIQRSLLTVFGMWALFTFNIILGISLFMLGRRLIGRTAKGDEIDFKIDGLKLFLQKMDRNYNWQAKKFYTVEQMIPYAMALGYIDKFMEQLKIINPDYNPYWYSGYRGSFYNNYGLFYSGLSSNITTSAPSSSSGSGGGGFSGGGGGGGGGGSW